MPDVRWSDQAPTATTSGDSSAPRSTRHSAASRWSRTCSSSPRPSW